MIAGTIRNSGSGWEVLIDKTHSSKNINDVRTEKNRIVIEYDELKTIHTLVATPDETLASEGYSIGASVGTTETWIYIYDISGNTVPPGDYIDDTANIWIYGLFSN